MTNSKTEPDPNGDVILVVSPPKQPRAYAPSRAYPDGKAGDARYRASSKHLSLASRYFEKRLNKEWSEGKELQKKGCVEMVVPDTDPKAFLILLNLMHCRTQKVPTSVTFDELVELAVQVDYFKCHGVLGLYPARWIELLEAERPNTYCDEIVKWIFISGVFNDGALFASVTLLATRQTKDLINTLDLPIPLSITSEINMNRRGLLRRFFMFLEARQHELETGECSFTCDSLRLGALIKQMKVHGLPWHRENENLEYVGLAPESVAKKILQFQNSTSKRRAPVKTSLAVPPTQAAKPVPSTSPASAEAGHNTAIKKDAAEKPPSNQNETVSAAVETPQTRFKVSSKHLTLASKYFKDHLKKRIAPTSTANEPGYGEVTMLDCDPQAFLIVMNIIHGKCQQVPKEADAAMLVKVADAVRYLDCGEACMFVVQLWTNRYDKKIVYDTWDNCLKWAYIGWAFRFPNMFTRATSAAMSWRCSSSNYPANLKLPERIKDDITKGWRSATEKAKSVLSAETTRLKGDTVYCHFACDSLHLGAIIKATSHMDCSSLWAVCDSLQSKTTHCTAGKPRCGNVTIFATLKSAFAEACKAEGLILNNYPPNE
ncbi:hypothetical protein CDV55_108401 [Aspergillus turcosus]|nr:hypothetical protein CDV55_108401 [Aspergillus turcosus]